MARRRHLARPENVIYLSADDIDSIATLQCDVSN